MAMAAAAKTPSTHPTMMPVLRDAGDGDAALCVAEELKLLDVEELLDVEGLCVEV